MDEPASEYARLESFYVEMDRILSRPESVLTKVIASVSGWSAADHAYHLSVINAKTWRGVDRILAQHPPAEPGGVPNRVGRLFFKAGRMKRGTVKAPDFVTPSADLSMADVRLWADRSETSFREMKAKLISLPEDSYRIPHQLLGPLNAREWLTFVRIHSLHHLAIIHDILGAHQKTS